MKHKTLYVLVVAFVLVSMALASCAKATPLAPTAPPTAPPTATTAPTVEPKPL
jgi:hypothetical protein